MGRIEIGSYEVLVRSGDDLLALIFDDIENKAGIKASSRQLRHVTITADDGNRFEINGFPFEVRQGIFCTPSNSDANLLVIRSFSALQNCSVSIYYIR